MFFKKLSFAKGKGSYLYTARGVKYLDFVQGIAVNSLGHSHPKLINAINNQSKKLSLLLSFLFLDIFED